MKQTIEVILFDLGGVLIELKDSPIPEAWLPEGEGFSSVEWFSSETAHRFERGQISASTFIERFKTELGVEVDSDRIRDHFLQWPIGLYPGADMLLQSLASRYRLAVLSNTNILHWPRIIDEFRIGPYFEHLFASHLLQMSKPQVEIFEHVIGALGVPPERIFYLDDNPRNIAVAQGMGIRGCLVEGVGQVRAALMAEGLVDE